jgi:dTDP-4-amino-4,6-dideoxygalactose transaminase
VDNDALTFQIDPVRVESALDGASAILATHVFGAPCAAELIEDLAATASIPAVFDAAHAIAARHNGRPVGGFGSAEIFSLTPTKQLVAGEGGLVATNDGDLAARLRIGRDYGNPGDYNTRFVGLNARMSEFHAAMALESLAVLDETLERRQRIALRYLAGLRDVPGIRPQVVPPTDVSTYKDFTVAVEASEFGLSRNQLVAVLAAEGVDTRSYFDPPVHRQEAYQCGDEGYLPIADATSRSVVSLPIYADLTLEDVDVVLGTIWLAHAHAEQIADELELTSSSFSHTR